MNVDWMLTSRQAVWSDKKASLTLVGRAVSRVRSRSLLGRQRREVGEDLERGQKDSETDSHSRRVGRCERNARAGLYIVSLRVATARMRALDAAMDYHSRCGDMDEIVCSLYRSRKRVLSVQSHGVIVRST
jgi:hypothetical protein